VKTYEWWILAGYGIGVLSACLALWLGRRDRSEAGRRLRMRILGVVVMGAVLPIGMFVETRLSVAAYLLLLLFTVTLGVTLFFRGRGWSEWP
jgi:FtsH-binding integral membrane protein